LSEDTVQALAPDAPLNPLTPESLSFTSENIISFSF
jgi:hypothetical protein